MGTVFLGVPPELALELKNSFDLTEFVETGTFKGGTSSWAAQYFDQVYTIEGWKDYYDRTSQAHQDKKNIEFIFGDSRNELPKVLSKLTKPALLWLDAHWMGDSRISAGTSGECPLMEELDAVFASGIKHFILIDDVHCFMGFLERHAVPSYWPSLNDVKAKIESALPDYYVTTHQDVIIAVPREARSTVEKFYAYLPEINAVVPTSNLYLHLLHPFAYLLKKYWGEPLVQIVRYEIRPPKLGANYSNVSVGKQSEHTWSGGMIGYLNSTNTKPIFILMLEDYWITNPVDKKALAILWNYMGDHPKVGKIDLSGDRLKVPYETYETVDGINLIKSSDDSMFQTSIQAAIWRSEFMMHYLDPEETPWEFEKRGTKRLIEARKSGREDMLVLGTEEPILQYVNACGGEGRKPGELDMKKLKPEMLAELRAARVLP